MAHRCVIRATDDATRRDDDTDRVSRRRGARRDARRGARRGTDAIE